MENRVFLYVRRETHWKHSEENDRLCLRGSVWVLCRKLSPGVKGELQPPQAPVVRPGGGALGGPGVLLVGEGRCVIGDEQEPRCLPPGSPASHGF